MLRESLHFLSTSIFPNLVSKCPKSKRCSPWARWHGFLHAVHSVLGSSSRHVTFPAFRKAESGGSTFTAEQSVVGASFFGFGEQTEAFSHLLLGLHLLPLHGVQRTITSLEAL